MNAEEMFEVWAPADSVWSAWVKPVLFAHLGSGRADMGLLSAEEMASALASVPPADGATAVVVDLPGATGVTAGMELARRGYRPVPLYNAVPGPTAWAVGADVVCDLGPIVWAIREATPVLAGMGGLRGDAPPVFLLDADRSVVTGRRPGPAAFDNRSVSLPTDFPSANLLLSRGIRRVVVVQPDTTVPQPDLAHTLLRYQEAGVEVAGISLARPGELERVVVTRPPMFRRLWHRFRATLGLQRNRLGGFGGLLPEPSASGG